MKTTNLTALAVLVGAALLAVPGPAEAEPEAQSSTTAASPSSTSRTYALIVANNESVDPGVEPLQYADDDGARYWEMFSSLADRAELLTTLDADSQRVFSNVVDETTPPTRQRLEQTVKSLSRAIERDRAKDLDTEVYLVFTGHGNVDDTGEGYLSLANGKLRRSELYREVIRPLDADYTHLIVDACHAYFMVNSRGGSGDEGGWKDDRSGETLDKQLTAYLSERNNAAKKFRRTVGVIVSTAGNAEVHEWSRFRGGVFSHELRSGLLGAADADGDGDVTYPEIEAYLVAANAAVTNPKARINVHARPPSQDRNRAVTALGEYDDATVLEIPSGLGGRYHVEDARGLRYADFHVDGAAATRLALLRAPLEGREGAEESGYYLRKEGEQARVPLSAETVNSKELAFAETTQQARGSVEEAYRSELYKTPFGPAFVAGFDAGRQTARPTDNTSRQTRDWRAELNLAYGMAPSMSLEADTFAETRPQHQMALGLAFRHRSGWGVGPFANYGLSMHGGGDAIHRASVGVEGSYRLQLTPWLDLTPRLRAGHQVVLASVGQSGLSSDPLGLRLAGALGAGFRLSRTLSAYVEGGVSGDIFTVDMPGANEQRFDAAPFGRIGVRF